MHSLDYLPLDDLVPAEENPKNHDEDSLDDSIDEFGYVDPVILDERTGRLVAGHGRTEALQRRRARGEKPPPGVTDDWRVPVVRGWASRDDQHAKRYLLGSNKITEAGGWTDDLPAFLASLDDLAGSGFTYEEVADLLAAQAEQVGALDPASEWVGMPDYASDQLTAATQVTINFPTDADARAFFDLIDRPPARRMWWPNNDGHVGSTVREQYVSADDA